MSYEPSDEELRSAADKTGFRSFASSPGFRHFANLIAKAAYRKGLERANEILGGQHTDPSFTARMQAGITAELEKIK